MSITVLAIDMPKVTGTVQVLEKDETGKTVAIMVDTGEETFLVKLEESHKALLEMEGKKVTLEGQITRNEEDDQATIWVKKYQVHQEPIPKSGSQHPEYPKR